MCIQLGQADPRLTREALNSSARAELGFERSFELSENSVELVKPFHPTFAATEYDSEPFPITLSKLRYPTGILLLLLLISLRKVR